MAKGTRKSVLADLYFAIVEINLFCCQSLLQFQNSHFYPVQLQLCDNDFLNMVAHINIYIYMYIYIYIILTFA